MVKRAKLTLNHPEATPKSAATSETGVTEPSVAEPGVADQPTASDGKHNIAKLILVAGITIASLIIFRQKIL